MDNPNSSEGRANGEQAAEASAATNAAARNHDDNNNRNEKDEQNTGTAEASENTETKKGGKRKPRMTPWTTAEWYDYMYTYYKFANKSKNLPSIKWYIGVHLKMPERVRSFCHTWKEVGLQQHLLREKNPRSKEVQECLNNFLKSRMERQQKKLENELEREKKRQKKAQEQIRQLKEQNRKQKASASSTTSPRKRARKAAPPEETTAAAAVHPTNAYHHAPAVAPSPMLTGRQHEEMEAIERAMQRHCQLRIERRFYEIFGSFRNYRGEVPGPSELSAIQQCIEENMTTTMMTRR